MTILLEIVGAIVLIVITLIAKMKDIKLNSQLKKQLKTIKEPVLRAKIKTVIAKDDLIKY